MFQHHGMLRSSLGTLDYKLDLAFRYEISRFYAAPNSLLQAVDGK